MPMARQSSDSGDRCSVKKLTVASTLALWENSKPVMNGALEDKVRRMADTRWGEGGWAASARRGGTGGKRRQAGADLATRTRGSRHSTRLEWAEKAQTWSRVVIDSEDEDVLGMTLSRRRRIRIDEE